MLWNPSTHGHKLANVSKQGQKRRVWEVKELKLKLQERAFQFTVADQRPPPGKPKHEISRAPRPVWVCCCDLGQSHIPPLTFRTDWEVLGSRLKPGEDNSHCLASGGGSF